MILGAAKWELYGIILAAGALLLLGTWLHGRHAGVESEKQRANNRIAVEQEAMIEHMAEVAKTMGAAVRMAHERENEHLDRSAALSRQLHEAREWKSGQVASDTACAAWVTAPVGCRLREPTDSGDGGPADIP